MRETWGSGERMGSGGHVYVLRNEGGGPEGWYFGCFSDLQTTDLFREIDSAKTPPVPHTTSC